MKNFKVNGALYRLIYNTSRCYFSSPLSHGLSQQLSHGAPCDYVCGKTHINELQSPSLLINRDTVEQNCRTMQLVAAKHNLDLRVHVKTHKTLQIAEMQLRDQTTKRIEVSTIPEAYYFANKGFNDILYGVILSESKFEHIEQISNIQSPQTFCVMTDSLYLTQRMIEYAKHNATIGFKWNIFIKVDSGTKRAGFDICDDRTEQQRQDLLETVRLIKDNSKYCTLHGLYQFSNTCYTIGGVDHMRSLFEKERLILMKGINEIKSECNVEIPIVSSGSTPACMTANNFDGITEIHPGNYVFFDRMQYEFGVIDDLNRIPISVMTRVIGRYRHRNEILIDCGSIGISLDKNAEADGGFGCIQDYPKLKLYALSQEVGKITTVDESAIDFDDKGLQYGEVLRLIPHHSCLMACQYPFYYITNDNDTVVDVYHKVGGW
eukprot:636755_1